MKKFNNKGFTLVELLAVIVVLALIMVFAIPTVLDASDKAHIKTFKLYGDKVLIQAQTYFPLNDDDTCASLSEMGMTGDTGYTGRVVKSTSGTTDTYTLYLADDKYEFNGVTSTSSDPTAHGKTDISSYNTCS